MALVRSRMLKSDRGEVLADNRYVQTYDSIRNQWDICRYFDFGTRPPGDNDSGDELDKGFEGMVPLGFPIEDDGIGFTEQPQLSSEEAEQEVNSYISDRLKSYTSTRPTLKTAFEPQDKIVDQSFTFDLVHYLSLHFEFTPPLPQPSHVDGDKWKMLLKNTGLRQIGTPIFHHWSMASLYYNF